MTKPRSLIMDQRYYGTVIGIVEKNQGGEAGKVLITYPWFDNNVMKSKWCRVCQFYVGNDYGAFWIPEEKSEVLVSFIQGDMRRPIILGGLYNGKDKPPSDRPEDKNHKLLKDHKLIKTKAGHEILLDDTGDEEKIVIKDSRKNSIVISTAKNTIKIESEDGKVIIKGKEVEIESSAEMKITSGSTLDAKAQTINLN